MSDNTGLNTPQDDADRIRLKRLAKLQTAAPSASGSVSPTPSTSSTPQPHQAQPKPAPKPKLPPPPPIAAPSPVPAPKKKIISVAKLDVNTWEHETLEYVFKSTLSKAVAEQSGYETVWLKSLGEELEAEGLKDVKLTVDLADRILIARLEIDPRGMCEDLDFLPVVASLPAEETIFEYLVGCWKRLNKVKSVLTKKGYAPVDYEAASSRLERIRHLVISYAGLTLQEPEMFPQPPGKPLGPPELVAPLLSLSALSIPLLSSSDATSGTLGPSDITQFIQDLARRFEAEDELDGVLGPVVTGLLFHPSLLRPEGLGGGDSSWRGVIGGLELLVSIKSVALMITRLPEWNPPDATPQNFEKVSLLGPLCRLGVFTREWPGIAQMYFSEPDKRSSGDVESSFASLRGTLKSLQSSLFQIFNTLVRTSPEAREAVLDYFTRVIALNVKRAGMQVDPDTVSSDSFMLNLQSVLYRFAEPFMDANFSKMDKIDPFYFANSARIDLREETRIKATSEEAKQWEDENRAPNAPLPNFISNIFFLTVAMSHYGYVKTIQSYTGLARHLEDFQRHLDMIEGDTSWMGTPAQARTQTLITQIKTEKAKIQARQMAFEAGLLDPELVLRSISFTNFLSTWLTRQADPLKKHPNPPAAIPLPKEVPMSFRVLPEYIVEDIVEYTLFAVQFAPDKFELSGKIELMTFILTFLNSTWYIKNPFLKAKINDALFMSIWGFGRERNGILGDLLNTHPMALKHLMPALTHFYIEVEQTGASSQFYDKFNARRNISHVLKIVWNNPTHREALNIEAKNVDKFIRFINLMINDVTYLMDESLSEMLQISALEREMDDKAAWAAQTEEYRRDRTSQLRSLERHASSYTTLGRSTVELLKDFTAETKAPFMMPEIVDKLAAMLDYNLSILSGPRYQDLRVRDAAKLKFNPKALLSDLLQIYLNLRDQTEFIQGVAKDGRSYSKELFERATEIAIRRAIKTETEVAQLRAFVEKVEVAKMEMLQEDEDLDDAPEEFLDPLMATLMKDPVTLPSSKVVIDRSTIKSHLLSDTKDPFNRSPLAIQEVIPNPEMKQRIMDWLEEKRKKKMDVD